MTVKLDRESPLERVETLQSVAPKHFFSPQDKVKRAPQVACTRCGTWTIAEPLPYRRAVGKPRVSQVSCHELVWRKSPAKKRAG